MNTSTTPNQMYGWKMFDDHDMAQWLVLNLRKLNAALPLPPLGNIVSQAKICSDNIKHQNASPAIGMSNMKQPTISGHNPVENAKSVTELRSLPQYPYSKPI